MGGGGSSTTLVPQPLGSQLLGSPNSKTTPQEHRPQRPTESSDPTQHAKGRMGDCLGPRKGATTRQNVTQGGGGGTPRGCRGGWTPSASGAQGMALVMRAPLRVRRPGSELPSNTEQRATCATHPPPPLAQALPCQKQGDPPDSCFPDRVLRLPLVFTALSQHGDPDFPDVQPACVPTPHSPCPGTQNIPAFLSKTRTSVHTRAWLL